VIEVKDLEATLAGSGGGPNGLLVLLSEGDRDLGPSGLLVLQRDGVRGPTRSRDRRDH
jgi:hypothetical protein